MGCGFFIGRDQLAGLYLRCQKGTAVDLLENLSYIGRRSLPGGSAL